MIVCRNCGTHNDDGDQFCGGCRAFLEFTGERQVEELPEPEPVEPERAGIVTRIKTALTGDSLPAPSAGPATLPPPPPPTAAGATVDARAAALVAKPLEEVKAAPEAEPKQEAGGGGITARTPEAVQPQDVKSRPKVKQPPSRKILPGDLICGACGEGNPDSRKFCRRCGEPLAEAEVAKARWWKRAFTRNKKVRRAGERPDRSAGRRAVGSKARIFRGKVLGRLADARRLIAMLALLGIGVGFTIPSTRNLILDTGGDALNRVRRIVSPTYSNIPIDPARVAASSSTPDAPATQAADSNTLTFWEADPSDPRASVTVVFVEPTDLQHVLIHPGKQENGGKVVRPDPRPRQVLFRVTDTAGAITEVPATLADEDGFQKVDLKVGEAVSVETVVVDCFPDPVLTVCPVTELEFQQKD